MKIPVDGLFFIGNQLVAITNTGKVAVWQSVQQHWQVLTVVGGVCLCVRCVCCNRLPGIHTEASLISVSFSSSRFKSFCLPSVVTTRLVQTCSWAVQMAVYIT